MIAQTYGAFMAKVDLILIKRIGLTHADLADFNSRDLFDDGVSALDAAEECLLNDDTYSMFFGNSAENDISEG